MGGGVGGGVERTGKNERFNKHIQGRERGWGVQRRGYDNTVIV